MIAAYALLFGIIPLATVATAANPDDWRTREPAAAKYVDGDYDSTRLSHFLDKNPEYVKYVKKILERDFDAKACGAIRGSTMINTMPYFALEAMMKRFQVHEPYPRVHNNFSIATVDLYAAIVGEIRRSEQVEDFLQVVLGMRDVVDFAREAVVRFLAKQWFKDGGFYVPPVRYILDRNIPEGPGPSPLGERQKLFKLTEFYSGDESAPFCSARNTSKGPLALPPKVSIYGAVSEVLDAFEWVPDVNMGAVFEYLARLAEMAAAGARTAACRARLSGLEPRAFGFWTRLDVPVEEAEEQAMFVRGMLY